VSDIERGRAVGRLGDYFPSGSTPLLLSGYLDQLRKDNIDTADVIEGVERVIHTRETRTFPPYAVLLGECREARGVRLKERAEDDPGRWDVYERLTPERTAELLAFFRDYRQEHPLPARGRVSGG